MIGAILKASWRNLQRQRAYFLINIAGLSMGLATSLLILSYVVDELSWDSSHAEAENIHRLIRIETQETGATSFSPWGYPAVGPAIADEIPEVKDAVRVSWGQSVTLKRDHKEVQCDDARYVDTNFLNIFTFPLLYGNRNEALSRPDQLVVSRDFSERLFGDDNPIGQQIELLESGADARSFVIGAVMDKLPQGSHLDCDILLPMTAFPNNDPNMNLSRWEWFWFFYTYLRLEDGADPNAVTAKLPGFFANHHIAQNESYALQSLSDVHLHSAYLSNDSMNAHPGSPATLAALTILALFLLAIAIINYINLATALADSRAREVGMRKIVGADRTNIVIQYLGEAFLLTFLAGIVGLGIMEALQPSFENLVGRGLYTNVFTGGVLTLFLPVLLVVTALLAGAYPSFVLSSFPAFRALRASRGGASRGSNWIRRGLVLFQLSVSATLILGSLMIERQIRYTTAKDLGFNRENIVNIEIPIPFWRDDNACMNRIASLPGVVSVSRATSYPGGLHIQQSVVPEGMQNEWKSWTIGVEGDALTTFGLTLTEGRFFDETTFDGDALPPPMAVLNETAVRALGWHGPIGKKLVRESQGRRVEYTVAGIVKDFHFDSLHRPIEPLMIINRARNAYSSYVTVRFADAPIQPLMTSIEEIWTDTFPGSSMDAIFLDDFMRRAYSTEQMHLKLARIFTGLAIFIALLGMTGLAAHTLQRRNKEIAIRKVLGATESQLLVLLSRESFLIMLISNLIAWPTGLILFNQWVRSFAYRASVAWWAFPLTFALLFLVTTLVTSMQAIRVTRNSPLEAIRQE